MSTSENHTPDWKIAELYQKSWEIVKKNKVLWIFGIAVAGLGGGGNFNSNLDADDFQKIRELFEKDQETSQAFPNTLGASTGFIATLVQQIFSAVPLYFYIILALTILVIAALSILIAFIGSAWANAALIHGIQGALKNEDVSIRGSSEKAFPRIKSLIGANIYITLIIIGILLVSAALVGIGFLINTIVGVILLIPTVIIGIVAFLYLTITGIWTPRLVVLENSRSWEGVKKGYSITKKKFWTSLLLGIVNTIMSGIVIGIPVTIIAGLLVGGFLSFATNKTLAISLFIPAGILGFVFAFGFIFISGVLTAFKASIWTIAYNKIRGKYDN